MTEARRKILSIEGERKTAALIAEELTERGFDVILSYDGHEGLVSIIKVIPDLVLCDINLPFMSGFEVLEGLNALKPRLKHVPFVFLTAMADRENELRASVNCAKSMKFVVLNNSGWHLPSNLTANRTERAAEPRPLSS
jgi:response regulator RpfG family c-di-GMP phosphodiesterase